MNAQQLLNRLWQMAESGTDLSALTVVVPYECYDGYTFSGGERYPDTVSVVDDELRLD